MTSRGAWPFYYQAGLDRRADPTGRDAHGIYAFKDELIFNGFGYGTVKPTVAEWGAQAVAATKEAQASFGLTADGVLGPQTARCLFRKRMLSAESTYMIPNSVLQQIASLESGNDPVAQGMADPQDEGLFQENLPSHPSLSQQQCWTPSYIIPVAARQLQAYFDGLDGSVKAAVAAWNIGEFYASEWKQSNFPASGKVVNGQDIFARATQYYALVTSQAL